MGHASIAVNKITALSLRFSEGSYIIPFSLIAGLVSINIDVFHVSIMSLVVPLIVFFYIYNHIRYMALQFKLSGYAKHLELKINEICGENILLWENAVARSNGQNFYEGIFLGIIYVCIIALSLCVAYINLANIAYSHDFPFAFTFLITVVYYLSLSFTIVFLAFFTNEHDASFRKAELSAIAIVPDNATEKGRSFHIRELFSIKIATMIITFAFLPISLLPIISCYPQPVIASNYGYVLILGNKSAYNQPSENMKERLDCYLRHFPNESSHCLILSGGNGEAEVMKEYLVSNGVPESIIRLEINSSNTYENFLYSSSMFEGALLVITNDYHVFRTNLICRKMGLDVAFLSAKSEHNFFKNAFKECYYSYFELFR